MAATHPSNIRNGMRVAATHPKLSRAIRVAATHPINICNEMGVAATHPKLSRAIRVVATHPSNIRNGMRVAATHANNIHNGMRVAATHPSNEQCSEGGSDTPCTVMVEATSGAHPHPGVNKLRWGGGPTRPATRR